MSRGIQLFRETDVTKAVRGALKAGLDVQRFEIERGGRIIIIASKAAPADVAEDARG